MTMRDDSKKGFQPARISVARRVDSLPALFTFCDDFCGANGVSTAAQSRADFVLEEIFTNLVKYNAVGKGDIEVELQKDADLLALSLTDFDSEEFDLRDAEEAAVDAPLEERTPGGLGIHLVRKFAKRIDYAYVDRKSKVTIYLEAG